MDNRRGLVGYIHRASGLGGNVARSIRHIIGHHVGAQGVGVNRITHHDGGGDIAIQIIDGGGARIRIHRAMGHRNGAGAQQSDDRCSLIGHIYRAGELCGSVTGGIRHIEGNGIAANQRGIN